MKSDSGTWNAVGRGLARRLGDGPEEERRDRQRQAVAALVAHPPSRRRTHVVAAAVAASIVAVTLLGLWMARSRDTSLQFWMGRDRSAGTPGDWLEVPEGEEVPVRFEDGSRLDVGERSLVRVTEARTDRVRVLLDHGRLVASVRPGGPARWSIEAGPYTVKVTGTQFSVGWDPEQNHVAVHVIRGEVRVQGPGLYGQGTTLGQGDSLEMASGARKEETPHETAPAVHGEPAPVETVAPPEETVQESEVVPVAQAPEMPLWKKLASEGLHEEAVAEAEKLGFEKLTRTLGKNDLWQLASAARFARQGDLAVMALTAYRDRFDDTARAGTAAYLLGRVEMEQNGKPARAATWLKTYLVEHPDGPLAEEALGRLMDAQLKAGQSAAARKTAQAYLARYPEGIFKELAESLSSN